MSDVTPDVATRVLQAVWDLPLKDRLPVMARVAAEVRIERAAGWLYQAQPRQPKPEACFACDTRLLKLYWHHIITVAHGGDDDPWNLVAICHGCHCVIHPWLPESTAYEEREGPYPLADWFKAKLARLRWRQR